jgi:hypothetical protein
MVYKQIAALALCVALLGAGCSLKPLESTDTEDTAKTETKAPLPKDEVKTPVKDDEDSIKEEEKDELDKPVTDDETEPTEVDEEPTQPDEIDEPQVSNGTGYGGKIIGELSMNADENSVVVFLVSEKGEYKGDDAYMEIGCDSLLVPVRRELTKTQSDLAEALVQLLTIKQMQYEEQGLRNAVAPSAPTIKLTNIRYEGQTRVIEFEGQFLSAGTCDDPRIKAQIEETVKLYVTDYEIRINGKESEWRCLFDQSGECA